MIENLTKFYETLNDYLLIMYSSVDVMQKKGCQLEKITFSSDWGKDEFDVGLTKTHIMRGTDISDINNGKISNLPIRYVKTKKIINKTIKPYDIIIEISGGSPNQSTGRNVIMTEALFKYYNIPLSTSGFSKIMRCKDKKQSIELFLALRTAYKNNMFFSYENGTTGIKNLNLDVLLQDLTVKSFSKEEYNVFLSIIELSHTILIKMEKLEIIKQNLLLKFF